MNELVERTFTELCERRDLTADAMHGIVSFIMEGHASEVEIAALLTALRVKGEAVSEIVGGARAMIEHATPIPTDAVGVLDTCGTGGDQLHTFNISTATAFVVAACGIPVAKHGNRSVSSSSGAADVLESLGVNIQLSPARVAECIRQVGLGFCFAPLLHGAMKHVGPVRKQLKFRTIFNLLGPLANPARAAFQLLGTGRMDNAEKLANALSQLGRRHAAVVCGNGELDEVALWGQTTVFEVTGSQVHQTLWTAADFGLAECRVEQIRVHSPAESAECIRRVLDGVPGPHRDIIVANTAAALWVAQKTTDLKVAAIEAAQAIDSGKAKATLNHLIEFSNSIL